MTSGEQYIYELVRAELKEDLVPQRFRGVVDSSFCGHCHHATLAMYYLLGGKQKGYTVRAARDELNIGHYWLVSPDGEIIDPTAEQYTDLNRPLPYSAALQTRISYRRTRATTQIIDNVRALLQLKSEQHCE